MKSYVVIPCLVLILLSIQACEEECEPFSVTIEHVSIEQCGNRNYVKAVVSPYEALYSFDLFREDGTPVSSPLDDLVAERDWYLSPGDYILLVKNKTGDCSVRETFTIQPVTVFTTEETLVNPKRCPPFSDGSIRVKVSGGSVPYDVRLHNQPGKALSADEFIFEAQPVGNHFLTVVDGWGCQLKKTITLSYDEIVTFDTELEKSDPNVPTGSITVTNMTGGTAPYLITVTHCIEPHKVDGCLQTKTYQQDSPNTFIDGLGVNTKRPYVVTVKDANGCLGVEEVWIESLP